jgi:type III secretory pathway lipoprotein EscJ
MRRMRPPLLALALCGGLAAGCGIELEHGLDERQANEAVAALDRAGIVAEKSPDEGRATFKVVVPRGEAARAFLVLDARGLPRRSSRLGEAFAEKGLLPSATAERARLSASLATDLERTLEELPAETTARVHLALTD